MQPEFDLRAAAKSIMKHRRHSTGMGDVEAMRFSAAETVEPEGGARVKVICSQSKPVSLSTGPGGGTTPDRLCQGVRRQECGEAFDKGFHREAVRAHFAVPPDPRRTNCAAGCRGGAEASSKEL